MNQQVPPGCVTLFAGGKTNVPEGWIRCNGVAVSRTQYAALFEAIGTTFGVGDGSKTFNVPDLRGRFAAGSSGGAGVIGDSGGTWNHDHGAGSLVTSTAGTHTHAVIGSTASAGSHSHTMNTHSHGAGSLATALFGSSVRGGSSADFATQAHNHDVTGSTSSVDPGNTNSGGAHTHGNGTLDTGTGDSPHTHNITGSAGTANPPYLVLDYIIKT